MPINIGRYLIGLDNIYSVCPVKSRRYKLIFSTHPKDCHCFRINKYLHFLMLFKIGVTILQIVKIFTTTTKTRDPFRILFHELVDLQCLSSMTYSFDFFCWCLVRRQNVFLDTSRNDQNCKFTQFWVNLFIIEIPILISD